MVKSEQGTASTKAIPCVTLQLDFLLYLPQFFIYLSRTCTSKSHLKLVFTENIHDIINWEDAAYF